MAHRSEPGARPGRTTRPVRAFPVIDPPRRDLLCALAYVYLSCGQTLQALVLLRLAERERPMDVGVLRILAYALVAAGDGDAALAVVDRLQVLAAPADARAVLLLRSHALRLAGRLDEARRCFRDFVDARTREGASPCSA